MTTQQQTSVIENVFVLDVLCDKTTVIKKCQNTDAKSNFTYIFNDTYVSTEYEHIKYCIALVQNIDCSYSIIMMKHFINTDTISENSYSVPYEELSEAVSEYLRYIDVFYTVQSMQENGLYETLHEMNHIQVTSIMKMM